MKAKYSKNIDELKILLDYAWEKYHIQHNSFERLDSKSSTLTTFIGLLFTIISGFIYYTFNIELINSIKSLNCLSIIFFILLIALLISISISFYFALSTLTIKKMVDVSKIATVKDYFKSIEKTDKQSQRKLLIYIINSLSDSEKNVREINFQKSTKVKLISLWLKTSLFLILSNLILYLIISFNK